MGCCCILALLSGREHASLTLWEIQELYANKSAAEHEACAWPQALAQLKRSTDAAWHDQLYSYAAVLSEKKDARRQAHVQKELDVRTLSSICV